MTANLGTSLFLGSTQINAVGVEHLVREHFEPGRILVSGGLYGIQHRFLIHAAQIVPLARLHEAASPHLHPEELRR
jgi:hypothetical protein